MLQRRRLICRCTYVAEPLRHSQRPGNWCFRRCLLPLHSFRAVLVAWTLAPGGGSGSGLWTWHIYAAGAAREPSMLCFGRCKHSLFAALLAKLLRRGNLGMAARRLSGETAAAHFDPMDRVSPLGSSHLRWHRGFAHWPPIGPGQRAWLGRFFEWNCVVCSRPSAGRLLRSDARGDRRSCSLCTPPRLLDTLSPLNFGPIARAYRWMEYATFAPALHRRR